MNKKILEYELFIEEEIEKVHTLDKLDNIHKLQTISIKNFQHERIVHLLITLFFALFSLVFLTLYLILRIDIFIIPLVLTLILLVSYIFHYYKLENGVQRLYKLDKILYSKSEELNLEKGKSV